MRVICPISGLPVYKSQYLIGFDLKDLHPIFRAKKKLLLGPDMIHKFMKSESFEEKKLIFLAVLNCTDLVEFRVPAMPTLYTIEKNFFALNHTASWLSHAEHTYKAVASFPQFVVQQDTQDLESIGNWIASLEAVKDMIIRKDLDRDRAAELSQRADVIAKEIREAASLNKNFTPALARWALDFAKVDRESPNFPKWMKMLCIPKSEAWMYDYDDYKELVAFLEEELPSDHPQVLSVMFQVRELLKECKRGFTELSVFNDDGDGAESFTIEDDELPSAAVPAPVKEVGAKPEPRNFKTRVEYLVADARWRLAMRALEKQNEKKLGVDNV